MKEQLTIFRLNKRQYNIKHQNNTFVFAIDYNESYEINKNIPMDIIYNSNTGLKTHQIQAECVSTEEKGIKKIKYMFRNRQNYSRTVGSRKLFSYVSVSLGGK